MSSEIEKTNFGPGKTPLYYNNVGLFSPPFLEDRLPNLEKYYDKVSTKYILKYWNNEESEDFQKFNDAFQDITNLWNKLDQDIPKFCAKERQLQNSWIDKIFRILGWTIELEVTSTKHGISNFPDYALFATEEDWKKSKDLEGNNKFRKAAAIADAKDWGIDLDGKGFSNKNPSYQIINYLKQTDKTWGILTDGKYWRIYTLRSESKHTTYYEIDLESILATKDTQRFKYFYNFFRKEAFVLDSGLGDRSFLDFVFEDGKFYSQRVEKNLNERVYKVVGSICDGFLKSYTNPTDKELREVYEYSMYYLFKLMFVLNCESKGLLEVNKQDDYYESSLRKKCIEIKDQFENAKSWSQQPQSYNYILGLFELLKNGDKNIGVHGFGKEPFEVGSSEFYSKNKIADMHLNQALLELACDYDDEGNLQFIDYKILSPDHIGSLFEGLLEFNLVRTGKTIELLNTKGERKSSGSYYTPDYLVDYIVKETLDPLVNQKTPKQILKVKVLDPSMGSGHFLLGVVKYFENMVIQSQDSEQKTDGAIEFDRIRKEILKNCVFGVDINPLAVQLAKFSLWIYTSQRGDSLEPLSDQFIGGNTLTDKLNWEETFKGQISEGSIDAIVGNPPYIGEKGNKEIFHEVKETEFGKTYYQGKMDYFYFFYHKTLDLLKDGGRAGMVSTNYFGTALGAKNLRVDLCSRSTINKIINFNALKIFKSAKGQHNQVTFFKKGRDPKQICEIFTAITSGACDSDTLNSILSKNKKYSEFKSVSNALLFEGEEKYIRISGSGSTSNVSSANWDSLLGKVKSSEYLLGDIAEVNTGIMGGCDYVTKLNSKYVSAEYLEKKDIQLGDGVFVLDELNPRDVIALKSLKNNKHLNPFFKNSDISKFGSSSKAEKHIIFSSKDNPATGSADSKKHLEKFKDILLKVRAINNENSSHWPVLRRGASHQEIFEGEKIVAPQRSKINTFGYNNCAWYASADVYFVTKKEKSDFELKYLLGLLNSKLYFAWLYHRGKRKGEALELYQKPLSELPIKKAPKAIENRIKTLTEKLIKNPDDLKSFTELNGIVYELYELTEKEVSIVEEMYNSRIKDELAEKSSEAA